MNRSVLSLGLGLSLLFCQAVSHAESLDALYQEGIKFYNAKDYKAAAEKLKQFTQKGKTDNRLPDAKAKLGDMDTELFPRVVPGLRPGCRADAARRDALWRKHAPPGRILFQGPGPGAAPTGRARHQPEPRSEAG